MWFADLARAAAALCFTLAACSSYDPTTCVTACGTNQSSCVAACAHDAACVASCSAGYSTCVDACNGGGSARVALDPKNVASKKAAAEAKASADRLNNQIRERQAKLELLIEQLARAKTEAERRAIQKQIDSVEAEGRAPAHPHKGTCNCTPGDPLCSCL